MIHIAAGLVLGALLVQQLPSLPPVWLLCALSLLGVLCLLRGWSFGAALLLGVVWAASLGAFRLMDRLPPGPVRHEVLVEGRILGIPGQMERGQRFDFQVRRILEPAAGQVPAKVRVSWYDGAQPLKAGDDWRLRLSLRPPRGMLNPGGFDYEQWLFAQGLRAVGYVRTSPDNRRVAIQPGWADGVQRWRQATYDRLDAVLGDRPLAGLLKALTMGVEEGITPRQWAVLRKTGTAHLIAISGSHIGLVAGFVFFLTRRLCARLGILRWSPPVLAAWAGLLAALLYSALAGFAIPTQRALLMIAVAMGAVLMQRHQRAGHVLALALAAVVLWDPHAVLAPGFWLSFGAVTLIAYGVGGRLGAPGQGRLLWRINWMTALGLAPLLMVFFRQVSLVSPLANLVAVPVLGTVLIPLCLSATLLLSVWPAAGRALMGVAELILGYAWVVLEWFAALPWAVWNKAEPPVWTLPFAVLGVIWLLAPKGIPGRWLGGILLLPALTDVPERPAEGGYRFTLLDVGQGLSAVVETRHRTLVFDAGARLSPSFDMGSAVIAPYLQHRGLDHIDALVISHGDNDHIGGARSLREAVSIAATYTSVPAALPDFPVVACAAGQHWVWDEVSFEMLGPVAPEGSGNDDSCVLRVSGSGGAVLLTGDIEAAGERRLVERYGDRLGSEALVAPHHGSKTSSTAAFLDRVSPRLVLIPAGYLNRFNFPHPAVVARYQSRQAELLTTGDSGAITLEVTADPGRLLPQPFRQQYRRYWSGP